MDNQKYRVIINGLSKKTDLAGLFTYLESDFNFTKASFKQFILSTPAMLLNDCALATATSIQAKLEDCQCDTIVQEIIVDEKCPVTVTKKDYQQLVYEVERSLMNGFRFVLFIIQMNAKNTERPLPDLMSQEPFRDYLTDEDIIIPIDNTGFIILSYLFGSTEPQHVLQKIDAAVSGLMGHDAVVYSAGYTLFPDEACDVPELLTAAYLRITEQSKETKKTRRLSLDILGDDNSPLEAYQHYLITATGKRFKWLSSQSIDDLWLGLGSLTKARQKEFLYRLPVDAPLVSDLLQAIAGRKKPEIDETAVNRISEIIIQISGFGDNRIDPTLKKDIKEKMNDIDSLPTLPEVAGKLTSILNDPDSTVEALSDVIKNDPALTLKLLKLVNSAFYNFQRKITTIEDAVVYMGRDEVMNLALGFAASKAIFTDPVKGLYNPKALWHHLIGTALVCRFLNQHYGINSPGGPDSGLFTAGMIHDFGKIFFIEHYPERYSQLHIEAADYQIPLYELEEECFGITHATIGKTIAVRWNLPGPLVELIAFHHQPFFAYDYSTNAAIMGFADYIYHMTRPSEDIRQVVTPHSPCLTYGHWELIKQVYPMIKLDDLEEIVQQAGDFLDDNQDVFGILT